MHVARCRCRVETTLGADGQRMFERVMYVSPAASYVFVKMQTSVLKLDAEHLKSYFKGQVCDRLSAHDVCVCVS